LSAAPPKRLLRRRRTSTKTTWLRSRQTRSTSPPRQRTLRAITRRPCAARCSAASASAAAPRACAGVGRAPILSSPACAPRASSPALRVQPPDLPPMSVSAPLPDRPLSSTPSLYVVATPLGNLHDITLRALALLAAVDVIAAEDTRHSQRLLEAHGIRTRLVAVHQHNEQAAAGQIIEQLAAGLHVALVTDAGTPAVSDPGARLVARVRA